MLGAASNRAYRYETSSSAARLSAHLPEGGRRPLRSSYVRLYVDAATAAIRRFHRCFLSDHRAKDAWRWTKRSYACSSADRRRQQFQVPIECVLTKFTHGLLSAPTNDRPLDSLGIYPYLPNRVK